MPEYVEKAPDRLQYPTQKRPLYPPHFLTVPVYGKILQMAADIDDSDLLYKKIHQNNTAYWGNHAVLFLVSWSNDDTSN